MTRRLTIAILGTVVAALVLAGLGTLVLTRAAAREQTEHDLRDEVVDLRSGLLEFEEGLADDVVTTARAEDARRRLRRLVAFVTRAVLRLDGAAVVVVRDGVVDGELPPGITLGDLDLDEFLENPDAVQSGAHDSLTYAAVGYPSSRVLAATGADLNLIVVTREADPELGPAVRWFLVASALTVIVGALVAVRLGRRLTRPLRDAQRATHQIAAGDLSARLPEPSPSARDELADLTRSVNAMADSLQRSRALEQQFLLSVSHDLRTPLTSIRGYAEAIADGAGDPRRAADVIQSEARRLERLVGDLLDLAKLDARTFGLQAVRVDLAEVARVTAAGFAPEGDGAEVRIETATSGPVTVIGDADRLAQVVANLVENAMKYAGSRVRIGVAPTTEGFAVLTVDDDGPGIAAEDLPHVFERLYVARARPARKESGSGLGLAIVRELVEAMGGTVAAEGARGGGARMVVRLPLATV